MWPFKSERKRRQEDFERMLLQTGRTVVDASASIERHRQDATALFSLKAAFGSSLVAMRKNSVAFPIEESGWALRFVQADPSETDHDQLLKLICTLAGACSSDHQIKMMVATCIAPDYSKALIDRGQPPYRLFS